MVEPALKSLLQAEASEEDFSEFKVLETIGHIYIGESECYNAEKALDYFIRAAKFAEPERKNPKKAAEYYMHASWAAYLLRDFDKAIKLVQKSISLNPRLSRSYYFLAKYYACLCHTDNSVNALEKAIRFDRNYCILVDIDGDFKNVRDGVLLAFDKLKNDAKIRAKQALDKADQPLNDLKVWSAAGETAALALLSFTRALEKYASDNFFGYLDVLPLTQAAIKYAQDAVNTQKQQLEAEYKSSISKLEYTLQEAALYDANQHARQEFEEASKMLDKIKRSSRWDDFNSWEKIRNMISDAQELAVEAVSKAREIYQNEIQKRIKRRENVQLFRRFSPLLFSLIGLGMLFSGKLTSEGLLVAIAILGPAVLVAILNQSIRAFFGCLGISFAFSIVADITLKLIVGKGVVHDAFVIVCYGLIGTIMIRKK